MNGAYKVENDLMQEAFNELRSRGELCTLIKDKLEKMFGERFANGFQLANSGRVRQYTFKPSGRIVWTVEGRKSEYQIIPDIPFCYCDDYYFRVMDRKRGLCYHVIAQRVAEALNRFNQITKNDREYSKVTDRWRVRLAEDAIE